MSPEEETGAEVKFVGRVAVGVCVAVSKVEALLFVVACGAALGCIDAIELGATVVYWVVEP